MAHHEPHNEHMTEEADDRATASESEDRAGTDMHPTANETTAEPEGTASSRGPELQRGMHADHPDNQPAPAELHSQKPDRRDELLADPPDDDYHLGRFAGYRRARRVRLALTGAAVLCGAAAMVAGSYYVDYLQEKSQRTPYLQLPPGTDFSDRSRTITWSSGQVRLAMHREPPGATAIELPDRILYLAQESRSAQVKVRIVDGKTEEVVVLFGKVIEELKP